MYHDLDYYESSIEHDGSHYVYRGKRYLSLTTAKQQALKDYYIQLSIYAIVTLIMIIFTWFAI